MGAQEEEEEEDLKSNRSSVLNAGSTGVLPAVEIQSLVEKAKFYTSLCLGTTACLSVFAFLFLVPFVIEPAITTILADYTPDPVACMVTHHTYAEGLKNCSWSSCREGCTSAALRCHQIKVNYSKLNFDDFMAIPVSEREWSIADTKFFVNTEGCGYPPRVNCSEFAKKYGYKNRGKIFPCYFSRTNPQTVVARYSWDDNLKHLVLALTVPVILFGVSLGVLCFWYCPPIRKSCGSPGRNLLEKYDRKEDILEEDEFEEDEEEY
ncbi:protein tipE isoform X1 [Leptopilina boulardi]|uniref:protein tipE isoform X1 n=1 Tax=Leptopilina boulardi TaxID=63433 RepID=UPI0021F69011|nr:protein tipE isoform X1 [Leptopilina boulardi]